MEGPLQAAGRSDWLAAESCVKIPIGQRDDHVIVRRLQRPAFSRSQTLCPSKRTSGRLFLRHPDGIVRAVDHTVDLSLELAIALGKCNIEVSMLQLEHKALVDGGKVFPPRLNHVPDAKQCRTHIDHCDNKECGAQSNTLNSQRKERGYRNAR